jgi:CHASE2 domain-containing sensor protein/tRNA A-37 threonylcarbamoyl transferase component Bud32
VSAGGRRRTGLLLSILITVFVGALAVEKPSYIEKFELVMDDFIYNLGTKKGDLGDIAIVAIDNQSVKEIGRWPWHRDRLAELISSIALCNPKVIGLDILLQRDFEEDTLGHTERLAAAIEAAGNVAVPFYFTLSATDKVVEEDTPEFLFHNSFVLFDNPMTISSYPIPRGVEIFAPDERIGTAAAAVGHVNLIPDVDGKIRREPLVVSYNSHYFPSFAVQVSRLHLGLSLGGMKINGGRGIQLGSREIRSDAAMRIPIKYSGGYNTFRYISALDVFEGNLKSGEFENKVVLVGYVAADNRDIVATPVTNVLPGVEKQATVIENLIHMNLLEGVRSNIYLNLFMILLVGAVGILVFPRISLQYRLIIILGCIFLFFSVGYIVFSSYGRMLQFFYPVMELFLFLVVAPMFEVEKRSQTSQSPADMTPAVEVSTGDQTIIANVDSVEKMGRYQIQGILGKGAMGTVYKGIDPAIGRPVAIKTIRIDRIDSDEEKDEMIKRLTAEAHSAGKLSHPNIITIFDVGQERNLQYIAMEYLEGTELEELMKQVLEPCEAARIIKQTADALDYAHRRNVIHRDIKPANIMILKDGTVKVMDFGIARSDNMHMTQTGITVGTPNYISPEQLQGADIDGRADIFSCGVVLYEALTGKKPFSGENISALVMNILNHNPPKPSVLNSSVPEELDRITMKALQKTPEERYQTACDFSVDLKKFLETWAPAEKEHQDTPLAR